MELMMKFLNCKYYNFDKNGRHFEGYTCLCFDPQSDEIVKCKSSYAPKVQFGDDIKVLGIPHGKYLNYEIA